MKILIELSSVELDSLEALSAIYFKARFACPSPMSPEVLVAYVDRLLLAAQADNRALFSRASSEHQLAFLSLAHQLGRTTETKWNGVALPKPNKQFLSEVSNVT